MGGTFVASLVVASLGVFAWASEPGDAPIEAPSTAAASSPTLLVLPVAYGDEVQPFAHAPIEDAVRRGIERSAVRGVAVTLPFGCEGTRCYGVLADEHGSRQLLRVRVTGSERDYAVAAELIDADGRVLASREAACELCGVTEIAETVEGVSAALAETFAELPRGPGFIALETEPSGAEVFIDGTRVGTSPLRLELTPGVHVLELRAPGFGDARRQIDAQSGVEERLRLRMLATDDDDGGERLRGLRVAGWTLFGVGLAGLGGGAGLWALDERPYEPSCPPGGADVNGRCPRRYDTLAGGIALTVGGAVALVTGIALVVVDARKHRPKDRDHRARVHVRPSLGGLALSF